MTSPAARSFDQAMPAPSITIQVPEVPITESIRQEDKAQASPAQSLIRPIIPMDVIAKHFSDDEKKPYKPVGLPPRPAARNSPPQIKVSSSPEPKRDTPSLKAKATLSSRRHSFSGESGFASTLASSIYGSDIIRPPSGTKFRDKMKIPEIPRLPVQVTGVPYSTSSSSDNSQTRLIDSSRGFRPTPRGVMHAPNPPPVTAVAKAKLKASARNRSGSTESNDSWKSDQFQPSRIPSLKLLPQFDFSELREKWPMPPTRVPTPEEARLITEKRRKRQSKSRQRSHSRGSRPENSSSSSSAPLAIPRRRPPPAGGLPTRPSRRPEALYF